jgi:hypothetical protein
LPWEDWDLRAIPRLRAEADATGVEGSSIAHELPELYRLVLERIATLETSGRRAEGLLIRRAAIKVYSRAWDDRAFRALDRLRLRAERVLDGHERPRVMRQVRPALRWSRSA